MGTINIFDCGCVETRPKEQSCRSYGSRWRVYIAIDKNTVPVKLILRCRDCGKVRHFILSGQNPALIQYTGKQEGDYYDQMVPNDI